MRVLMLGWEFPPYFAGGVGTVCYELTRGLARQGVEVTYLMPYGPSEVRGEHVKLLVADREMRRLGVKVDRIRSMLSPYASKEEYAHTLTLMGNPQTRKKLYGPDLLAEIERFAHAASQIALEEDFDVIHAHDWTTIPAALAIKRLTGKPVVLHVHITEFDKTGGEHADSEVYRIERDGFLQADRLIAVSNFVKHRLVESYRVPEHKITVIHNAVEGSKPDLSLRTQRLTPEDKIVLFLGRVTLQKGPDYFLAAAQRVAMLMPDVKFVVAGTGDMLPRMIERAAELGLASKVLFTGFVDRDEGDRLYRMADLFVMPSVSEPFGIVPLEAMRQGTPVIISKQSGVAEVLTSALKVDFWDVEELANKIIAALSYPVLHGTLQDHTSVEIQTFTWCNPARQCKRLYEEIAW